MSKELKLHRQDKEGHVLGESIPVCFDDAEWSCLKRFAEFSAEVADTPLVRERRPVAWSLSIDFTAGRQSHTVTLPAKEEIQALLHVMRPFVLQDEPTSFNKVANILKRRIDDDHVRGRLDHHKDVFSGREFQQQMTMTASSGPDAVAVLNSEATFQLWLNAYEYHRDEEKKAQLQELHALMPFEWLRAMFVSMMVDRARTVLKIASFIGFLETSTSGDGVRVRL